MRRTLVSLRKNLRVNFRLMISYLQANWRLFILGLLVSLIGIYSFPQILSAFSFKKPHTIGLVGNHTIVTLPLFLQKEISFGLTTLTADNQATNGAAVSFLVSNDNKSVIFNLDKNLFWQDGTKFDTSQINYNLKRVDVKRLSLYSLQFNFKEPFAPMPTLASQPLFKSGLVGLGKLKVETIKYNGRFLQSIQLLDTRSGERIVYKFFPTEQIAINALKLGVVQQLKFLHQTYQFENDSHYKIESMVSSDTQSVIFLNLRKELLEEKSIRQSLAYSLPDDFPQGLSAFSSLPKNSWAQTDSVKKYPQNTSVARQNVEKLSTQSGKLKIILSSLKELQPVAQRVAQSWNEIGIQTAISFVESPPPNFDAFLSFLSLPPDPDQYALWHSTQLGNISGYKSFKTDRLLEDGRKTFDLKKRQEIYSNFQKTLSEDIPAIFLYYPKLYTITRVN